jgi:hypothetical protein
VVLVHLRQTLSQMHKVERLTSRLTSIEKPSTA